MELAEEEAPVLYQRDPLYQRKRISVQIHYKVLEQESIWCTVKKKKTTEDQCFQLNPVMVTLYIVDDLML